MSYMQWTVDLEMGIDVIDNQHRRIVDYINQLHHAIVNDSREETGQVLEQLIDYTLSHFAFEEELLEEAGYPFIRAHKKVHELFARKMAEYQQRFELGEDVSRHLMTTLRTWLINHIKRDDADYSNGVKVLLEVTGRAPKKKGFLSRLLGG